MSCFGPTYASHYDLFYDTKDYGAEAQLVRLAASRAGAPALRRVLDLGCGTGNHALALARAGLAVTGVDVAPDMVSQAAAKAREQGFPEDVLRFQCGDLRTVDLGMRFELVTMMFAVLGYMTGNDDVLAALRTVRRHLVPDGAFVFDVWYGPAVLALRPNERMREFPQGEDRVLRFSSGELDTQRHTCDVTFRTFRLRGQDLVAEDSEVHCLRYFFPQELALFLELAGLRLVGLHAFPTLDQPPAEDNWNVLGIAVAEGEIA